MTMIIETQCGLQLRTYYRENWDQGQIIESLLRQEANVRFKLRIPQNGKEANNNSRKILMDKTGVKLYLFFK